MIFPAILIVLAASETLAIPSKSFLHHVDFPGSTADSNNTKLSEGEPSSSVTSRIAENDTIAGSSKIHQEETSISSQASSVEDGIVSSEATAVDASSKSKDSKERLLRSILEQADMSVDADEQSTSPTKCRCPSGECFGDVCRLMDLTSISKDENSTATSIVDATPNTDSLLDEQSSVDAGNQKPRLRRGVNAIERVFEKRDVSQPDAAQSGGSNSSIPPDLANTGRNLSAKADENGTSSPNETDSLGIAANSTGSLANALDIAANSSEAPNTSNSVSAAVNTAATSRIAETSQNTSHDSVSKTEEEQPPTASIEDETEIQETHIQKIQPRPVRGTPDDTSKVSKPAMSESSSTPTDLIDAMSADHAHQKRSAQDDSLMAEGRSLEETTTLKMAADIPKGFVVNPMLLERTRRLYVRSVVNEVATSTVNSTANSTIPEPMTDAKEVERVTHQAEGNTKGEASAVKDTTQQSAVVPPLSTPGKEQSSSDANKPVQATAIASDSAKASATSSNTPQTLDNFNNSRVEVPRDVLPEGGSLKDEDKELTRTKYVRDAQETSTTASLGADQAGIAETSGTLESNTTAELTTNPSIPAKIGKNLPTNDGGNLTSSADETKSSRIAANSTGGSANASHIAANSTEMSVNSTEIQGSNNATEPSPTVGPTTTTKQESSKGSSSSYHHRPGVSHKKYFRPVSEAASSRNERVTKDKEDATREQEDRRLGDYPSSKVDRHSDIGGPLDIRTMGGNQLDIDPVDLNSDVLPSGSSSTKFKLLEDRSSPDIKSASTLRSPAALLSLLTSALAAAYLRL